MQDADALEQQHTMPFYVNFVEIIFSYVVLESKRRHSQMQKGKRFVGYTSPNVIRTSSNIDDAINTTPSMLFNNARHFVDVTMRNS